MKYTPELITTLEPGQIFVFGSNLAGVHGGGAALFAFKKLGAKWGQGIGLQGRTYAIPTKDENIESLPIPEIGKHVQNFLAFAAKHPEMEFLVTPIGTGLAGFTFEQMGNLFKGQPIPSNVILPKEFWTYIKS